MNEQQRKEAADFLNTLGYAIDFNDEFWMEEQDWGEHKTKEICELMHKYAHHLINKNSTIFQGSRLIYPGPMEEAQLRNFAKDMGAKMLDDGVFEIQKTPYQATEILETDKIEYRLRVQIIKL